MIQVHTTRTLFTGLGALLLAGLLTGCAEWSSRPANVERDFGNAVREMRQAQVYDRSKVLNPDPEPVNGYEGKKAEQVLEKAYRKDIASPQRVEKDIMFRISGGGGGGGGGGN